MSARYSPAATRGTSAAPTAAPARLPCSARHQLWHLVTPLLRALLLLSGLAAAGPARAGGRAEATWQAGAAATGVYTPRLLVLQGGQPVRLVR